MGSLKCVFKIHSKDEFTDNRTSTFNMNHIYSSPGSYNLNIEAHFYMLIVLSLKRHMHDHNYISPQHYEPSFSPSQC